MFQRIIVPVDGSERSWTAARVGAVLASACDAQLDVVTVVFDAGQSDDARSELRSGLLAEKPLAVEPDLRVLVGSKHDGDDTVGDVIARHAESVNGAMVVMSSTGRGRSAAVLGSNADDVMRAIEGPIVVVGPHVEEFESFAGEIHVPVDGSEFSETSLPIAAAWATAFGATPWIVEVLTEPIPTGTDVMESSYAQRLAHDLQEKTDHDVEFEVLHGPDPGPAIANHATASKARLILMSTHGRTGLRRLTVGSTAGAVVHRATCPVVLHRPPRFALD